MKIEATPPNQPAVDAIALAIQTAELAVNRAINQACDLLGVHLPEFERTVVYDQVPYPGTDGYEKPPIKLKEPETGFAPNVLAEARCDLSSAIKWLGMAATALADGHEKIRKAACDHNVLPGEAGGGK